MYVCFKSKTTGKKAHRVAAWYNIHLYIIFQIKKKQFETRLIIQG